MDGSSSAMVVDTATPHTSFSGDSKIQLLLKRVKTLRSQGCTEQTSVELRQLMQFMSILTQTSRQRDSSQSTKPEPRPDAENVQIPGGPRAPTTRAEPAHVNLTPAQMAVLKAQIAALGYVSRGQAVPHNIQQAIHSPDSISSSSVNDTDVSPSEVEVSAEGTGAESSHSSLPYPDSPHLENDKSSGIYPYNAFRSPRDVLTGHIGSGNAHKYIVPSLIPAGLDPYQIMLERQRYVEARMENRIQELSRLPITLGDGGSDANSLIADTSRNPESSLKLRVLIELKALKLREKQRTMRISLVNRMQEASSLAIDRKVFRRTRKPTLRDARQTEALERQQRVERERRAKQKHLDYLEVICEHGRAVINSGRSTASRAQRLGKAVQKFHGDTEKEEQRRIERISRERLKALKADDEEAYMKLIDTAKDTRITHLLRQTDSYLESLAQSIRSQQSEYVGPDLSDDTPTDERTFGASKPDDVEETKIGKVDYYGVAHRISERIVQQPRLLIGGQLKDYQMKGLQWMVSLYNNKLNGILADEMGLGKTIQTISLVCFLIDVKREQGPFLVVVPLSTLTNWTLEFKKWAPGVSILVYNGSPAFRKALQPQLRMGQFQVLLTTYEYIIREKAALSRLKWAHMIIDEGHRMKNTQSKLSQTLTQFYSTRHRLILTGTPLQNNLPELWSLLNFVLPKIFNSVKSFEEWFNTPFANTGAQDKLELNEEETLLVLRRLHKVLRPFLLRRLKKDVESELPDKVEKVIKCKMSGLQYQLYQQMKKYGILFDEEVKGKQTGIKGLNNTIMQFRKICQHPFVFPQIEDRINASRNVNMSIIRSAGKVVLLDQLLPKLFNTGHRVLIFFQMTNVMDIVADYFHFRGFKHYRLDGSTKPEDRATLLTQFNDPNTDTHLFMLSTRAGGLGLNLQTADTVVIYDSDWNPHADLQAQDRAHRIGQKKDVRIFRFVTEKSIEEVMLARAKSKLDMDGKVIQAGRFDNKSTAEEQEEYLRTLLDQDQDDETEESAGMDDDEINDIVARSEAELILFREMDIQRAAQEQKDWHQAGHTGHVPPRLMQVSELPEVYQRDEPVHVIESEGEGFTGRGARVRNVVRYTDGLTDDQWAEALEDGTIDEVIERKAAKTRVRTAIRVESSPEASSPQDDDEWGASTKKRRGKARGRPLADSSRGSPMPQKRKRVAANASTSATPSMLDEDDEYPDNKRRKTTVPKVDVPAHIRERLKKVFNTCFQAVGNCADEDGRRRCELFKELPSKKEYPDYYSQIVNPISMAQIRKKINSNQYKTVTAYADDWRLMFSNAQQYNQEGSWVYNDAVELSREFESTYFRETSGTDLPGADGNSGMQWQESRPQTTASKSKRRGINWSDDDDYLSD